MDKIKELSALLAEEEQSEKDSYLEILKRDVTKYVNSLPADEVRELLIIRMVAELYENTTKEV